MADPICIVIDAPSRSEYDWMEQAALQVEGVVDVRPGKVIGCPTCDYLMVEGTGCEACAIRVAHPDPRCQFRVSATCAVPIECEHGFDCCPACDPCTCSEKP